MKRTHPKLLPSLGWIAVLALFTFPVFTLTGAVDMFLKLDKIEGESQDPTHSKEIDVLAWTWGASNSGTTHTGAGGGSGKANVQDLSFTKYIDKSSPTLLLKAMKGDLISSGLLTIRKAGSKVPLEYIKLELKDILVTSVSTGGSGGEDRLAENITLNFAKYKLTYTPQNQDGSAGPEEVVQWNIAENNESF